MKLWHISDTHCKHDKIKVPEADIVVHSGDFSNHRNLDLNYNEVLSFLDWFSALNIKYKILVPGNHDVSLFHKRVLPEQIPSGIIYLENKETVINGVKFYGAPQTPTFGKDWAWNVDRSKIHKHWDLIPNDTDVIITHGPPFAILDLTFNNELERAGCKNLLKRISRIGPQAHLFGHIHNSTHTLNSGLLKLSNFPTTFSNGSCVEDGTMNLISNGNLLWITSGTNGS